MTHRRHARARIAAAQNEPRPLFLWLRIPDLINVSRFTDDNKMPSGRIEMYLISRRAQTVTLDGEMIEFEAGETICTEHSHKYTVDEFATVAAAAGLTLRREWTAKRKEFAVLHFAVREHSN